MLDDNLGPTPLGPAAARTVSDAKGEPLAVPGTTELPPVEATRIRTASADASTSAFHLGVAIAAGLMILGGIASGFGIKDPNRRGRMEFATQRDANSIGAGSADAGETPGSEPA